MVMTRDEVIDLILDMREGGATDDEMAKVIDFSRVIINAERDIKNYYDGYDIARLIRWYGRKK